LGEQTGQSPENVNYFPSDIDNSTINTLIPNHPCTIHRQKAKMRTLFKIDSIAKFNIREYPIQKDFELIMGG